MSLKESYLVEIFHNLILPAVSTAAAAHERETLQLGTSGKKTFHFLDIPGKIEWIRR